MTIFFLVDFEGSIVYSLNMENFAVMIDCVVSKRCIFFLFFLMLLLKTRENLVIKVSFMLTILIFHSSYHIKVNKLGVMS